MTIRAFEDVHPQLAKDVYVDDMALVLGDVEIGENSSIWPFSVVRGDVNAIRIGARSNLQDNCVVHVSHDSYYLPGGYATIIGDEVTVGHQVILHGCQIGNRCLIGMGSVVMDGVTIEAETILGAGSIVTEDKTLAGGYLWLGRPARRMRELTQAERDQLLYSAQHYVRLKDRHLSSR